MKIYVNTVHEAEDGRLIVGYDRDFINKSYWTTLRKDDWIYIIRCGSFNIIDLDNKIKKENLPSILLSKESEVKKEIIKKLIYDIKHDYDFKYNRIYNKHRKIGIIPSKSNNELKEEIKSNNNTTKADRYNDDKPRPTLIDFSTLKGVIKVLDYGERKYSRNNWKKGLNYTSIMDSLLRHAFAFLNGEDIDKESGLHHVDHMGCNIMFLKYMIDNKPEFDDRDENKDK